MLYFEISHGGIHTTETGKGCKWGLSYSRKSQLFNAYQHTTGSPTSFPSPWLPVSKSGDGGLLNPKTVWSRGWNVFGQTQAGQRQTEAEMEGVAGELVSDSVPDFPSPSSGQV